MKIALRFVEGALSGQIKEAFLFDKKHVLVGRDLSANIVIPEQDRTASTTHAKIVFEKGEIWINDVGSHYGTFVNHKPTPRAKIKHGDFIRFGAKGPLAEFLVVPEGQTLATPAQKPPAPLERNAQSATGAPIQKRGRPAATRMMSAPTPEMLAMLAGDVAASVAAAAGAPMPQAAPEAPAYPRPQPVPPGGFGAPVVVLPPVGQPRAGAPGTLPPPMPVPRPQAVPPPVAGEGAEPPSGRSAKTQVGMSAMMNPAMRRRLEQQGKLPAPGAEEPLEMGEPAGWEDDTAAGVPSPLAGAPAAPGAPAGPGGATPPFAAPAAAPLAPPAESLEDTKVCPFCAERIKKQAIKCRYCGEYFVTSQAKPGDPDAPSALDDKMYALPRDGAGAAIAALPPPSTPGGPPTPAFAARPGPKGPPPIILDRYSPDAEPPRAYAPAPGAPGQMAPPPQPAWGPPPFPGAQAPAPTPQGSADEAPNWDLPSLDDAVTEPERRALDGDATETDLPRFPGQGG